MNQNELVDKVSDDAKITKIEAAAAIKALVDAVESTLKSGGKVSIAGLGIFRVKENQPRQARNPKTGEKIQVPAKKRISFRPNSGLKATVRG